MEPTQEIISGLEVPIRSFRIFALEQAIQHGASRDLLQALEKMQGIETDEECLTLLPYALGAVRGRVEAKSGTTLVFDDRGFDLKTFSAGFSQADKQKRLQILLSIPSTRHTELAEWALDELSRETSPAVSSLIIRCFGTAWPLGQLKLLHDRLSDHFVTVRAAALDTLVSVAPFSLKEFLPRLLQDEDPRIVATAIKGMVKIDPEEARNHIENELMGRDPLRKLAFLRVVVVLPLRLVKTPLLKYLSYETEKSLLEKAGLPLQINPDPEVPYRLLEIMAQAGPKKAAWLKEILDGACQIIQDSGLMTTEFPGYLTKLQEALHKRGVVKSLRLAIHGLGSEDEVERQESEVLLLEKKKDPLFREAVKAGAELSLTQGQQKHLNEIISQDPEPSKPEGSVAKLEEETFLGLPAIEQIRWLARLRPGEKGNPEKVVSWALNHEKTSPRMKAVALRAAIRLSLEEFRDLSLKWLSHQEDSLVAASLEYLATFDLEKALPLLGKFLKSTNPKIKLAAMGILSRQDPGQAVSALMALLKNPDQRSRNSVLACLMSFDFSLIREPLVEFLESSHDVGLLEPCLFLFQNNPAPENLFLFYRLEKCFPEETRPMIATVRDESLALMESLKLVIPDELKKEMATFPERWEKLKVRKSSPPPYSVEVLKALREKTGDAMANQDSILQGMLFLMLGIGVFSAIWIGTGYFLENEPVKKVQSGGLLALPAEIEGIVTAVLPPGDEILVKTADQTIFQLVLPPGKETLKIGDSFKAEIRPFRQVDGKIFARFISLKKL